MIFVRLSSLAIRPKKGTELKSASIYYVYIQPTLTLITGS